MQRTVGITFVFVTHDQEEALTLSDRIAVMSRGRVLQTDTPTRLYEAPNTREVASFIGTMNFFNGTVREVGERDVVIDTEGLGVVRAPKPRTAVSNGKSVQVAIRPENLVLSDAAPNSGLTAVRGKLENSAYLGERSHYYVRLQDMDQPVAVSSQNRQPITDIQAENRSVWLGWNTDAVVVLDVD